MLLLATVAMRITVCVPSRIPFRHIDIHQGGVHLRKRHRLRIVLLESEQESQSAIDIGLDGNLAIGSELGTRQNVKPASHARRRWRRTRAPRSYRKIHVGANLRRFDIDFGGLGRALRAREILPVIQAAGNDVVPAGGNVYETETAGGISSGRSLRPRSRRRT